MNEQASLQFGEYYKRIPLKKSPTIVQANALRIEWESLIRPLPWETNLNIFNFIFGNPPFLGHHYQAQKQKEDLQLVFGELSSIGVLDYVSAWYLKAAKYLESYNQEKNIVCAFVSTNSICQGEQVGILWNELMEKFHIQIHFAHRTFKWNNEAKGNAAVHVVIVGFSNFSCSNKKLYEYEDVKSEPHEIIAKNINPYLVDGPNICIETLKAPICPVPRMVWGNKPTDGGNLIFSSNQEKNDFLEAEPGAAKWIRPYKSGEDLIHSADRWCLWLPNISPSELKSLKTVYQRVEQVRLFRLSSKAEATRKKAATPTRFAQIAQPDGKYLAVPEVSSERRTYIPIAFLGDETIVSNTIQIIPSAKIYHFGVVTSIMHMSWVRYTCGRLKSDFRYSNSITYNNFPWPENPSEKQKEAVEKAAQAVLDVRAQFPESSLADLYDPNTMPPVLVKAHQHLDKAVDLCYRPQPFVSETKRIEFLFELYEKYTSGLFGGEKKSKAKQKNRQ